MATNKDNKLFVTLKDVLEEVKVDLGLSTNNKDLQLFQWILRGVENLALASQSEVKVKFLPVNKINTVILPSDFFDLVRIGVLCGDKIKYFTNHLNMAKLLTQDNCGTEIIAATESCCKHHNQEFERLFGQFRLDIPNGIIRINTGYLFGEDDKVYLEYISNGIEKDGDLMVRAAGKQALIAYVHWQNSMYPTTSRDVAIRKQQYDYEAKRLNRINNPLSIADIREVVNKNMMYEPKW